MDRRSFVFASAGALTALGSMVSPVAAANDHARFSADEGLQRLLAGNTRFVEGHPQCGPLNALRVKLADGQSPFAMVLGCSDSRVPIETIFDQEPGDVFVVRVAGNVVNDNVIGSMEYSEAILKSTLLLVLGHSNCGAVKAAIDFVKTGTPAPGQIQSLVEAIAPAVRATQSQAGDWLANAITENARMSAKQLVAKSDILMDAVTAGSLKVVSGVYDLQSGIISFPDLYRYDSYPLDRSAP